MDFNALISGLVVTALTQLAKNSKSIPINSGDKAKLRALAGGLSILAVLVTDFSSGTLASSSAFGLIGNFVAAFVTSQLSYKGIQFGARKLL